MFKMGLVSKSIKVRRKLNLTKEELIELYENKKLNTYEIAKMFSVDPSAIRYWMIKYNIPRRKDLSGLELGRSKVGYKHSLETRKKMSKNHRTKRGYKPWNYGVNGLIPWNKGRSVKDFPQLYSGPRHHFWKDGKSNRRELERHSVEYKNWRESVFKRDNYTCMWCKKNSGILHADHIKEWAKYPKLRYIVSNGRTLCKSCYNLRHGVNWI